MGISGLLPILASITRETHISDYSGQVVAVDGYVWLHRAAYSCAEALCVKPDDPKTLVKLATFFMGRVKLLENSGVHPYIVFDGGPLPQKCGQEVSREQRRSESLSIAKCIWLYYVPQTYMKLALEKRGEKQASRKHYVKAVDITPQMARFVINELIRNGTKYVVAPYEADSQLAFLSRNGEVDAVLSEDSDLLVFGCKRVLFKMEANGSCQEVRLEDLGRVEKMDLSLWNEDRFALMCVLSGCDYVNSLPGIGLKNAFQLVKSGKNLGGVLRRIRMDAKHVLTNDYISQVVQALLTFRHQRVFDTKADPTQPFMINLLPLPKADSLELSLDLAIRSLGVNPDSLDIDITGDFFGPLYDDSIAREVASGGRNPVTKELSTVVDDKRISPEKVPLESVSLTGNKSKFFNSSKTPLPKTSTSYFAKKHSKSQQQSQKLQISSITVIPGTISSSTPKSTGLRRYGSNCAPKRRKSVYEEPIRDENNPNLVLFNLSPPKKTVDSSRSSLKYILLENSS